MGQPVGALLPQSACDFEGVNVLLLPPLLLLACGVDLVVMDRAEGDCEFVADLEAQSPRLSETHVVSVRGAMPEFG